MINTALIMVTYKDNDLIFKAINSIYKYTKDFHLYLICNQSDKIFNKVRKLPNSTILLNTENKYWAGGINQGLRLCLDDDRIKYICFLNDDIEVYENWLLNIKNVINSDNLIGVVNPLTDNNIDNVSYKKISHLYENFLKIDENMTLKEKYEIIKNNNPLFLSVGNMIPFFCTLFKKETILKIGYLYEQFVMGADDDYCKRSYNEGYVLGICTNTIVNHFGGSSIKNIKNYDMIQKENLEKFIKKHNFK